MRPEITLITKQGPNPVMSKHISLNADGTVRSDGSQCLMFEGSASRASAETASELAGHIATCGPNQAITLGSLKPGVPNPAKITVQRMLKEKPGAIARSRDFIDYRPGQQAWGLVDFDMKGMPGGVAASIEAAGGSWSAVTNVAPGLARASRVSRSSTSAGLFRTDTGAELPGSGGAHHYVLIRDGSDIDRLLRDLHDRCWLQGLGWHQIGKAGQLLERSLVDRMVGYGERLCFEGAPVTEAPLAQDPTKRMPQAFEGEAIDTRLTVPPLNEYERHRVTEAKKVSADALAKLAAEVRAKHDNDLASRLSAKTGMPMVTAHRLVAARHSGTLLPWFELEFDGLGTVLVLDVLANPDHYIGETLADPFEGVDYGRCKAKLMRDERGGLFIHSFAHGRTSYRLRHDAQSAKAALANAPAGGVVDYAMAVLAMAEMEADELAEFAETVAKAAKTPISAVKARIKKLRKEQKNAELLEAAAGGIDARIIRPRPAPDGELTPTVTFLDHLLTADPSEEPPMRDASGKLVEVRVHEPWNMHALTNDGTNSTGKGSEAIAAPVEPILVQLSPPAVELMIERYVRWSVETENAIRFGALPRAHIDALMQYSPSSLPIARLINSAPLVSMSGVVIDGAGLDRQTGLVHRIDPHLRACLPSGTPSDEEVRAAMRFLMDEWLVDVALDARGKSVVIMLALTLIERGLLPERPAFFITAGQRGGGKTTLANMVTLAVLGRHTSATNWSDNLEERRKALFSHFRQGVSCIAWDNIYRGASISCPHIEAALTAPEISDRVLGVSNVETVPSTTVQLFTGNNILPCGDLASRSLILNLIVDRPDPENRTFVHSDPLGWTQENRPKIMRALYTLLKAGAINRPKGQTAKTRFKTWWKLVGWPVENATNLVGLTVDCTELMRAGEIDDEEATGASEVLSVLREVFGDREFTAREVVSVMEPTINFGEPEARAARLCEALGDVVGKRLERPTAHSIGKLFQKRLIGRPAWIEDGRRVATLRRTPGHGENRYRVQVSANTAGGHPPSGDSSFASDERPEHSPLSPHSPTTGGNHGESGESGESLSSADGADAKSPSDPAREKGIPFVMTQDMRRRLNDLGYDSEAIGAMTPVDAWRRIKSADKADARSRNPPQSGWRAKL